MNRNYLRAPRLVIGTTLLFLVCLAAALPLLQRAANSAAGGAASASLQNSPQGDRVALKLYYSDARKDNFTTATADGERDARNSRYRYANVDCYLLRNEEPGSVPLKLYYSDTRGDNFTTATQDGERDARNAGYRYVRVEGYVYRDQQPGTVPLKLYYSDVRRDNFTTASSDSEREARRAGYRYVRVEGYVFPGEGGGGGGGGSLSYIGCYPDWDPKDLDGYHWVDERNMTTERCVASCKERGFKYAGLAPTECTCGNSYGRYGTDSNPTVGGRRFCDAPCSGNPGQKCGGSYAISVYQVGG